MYHCDPAEFHQKSAQFGPIGNLIYSMSRLELAQDELIFALAKVFPRASKSISKRFPRQFKDKTDFLIEALWSIPLLRTMPMNWDGVLNTQQLQYQLDELYDLRSIVAHGAIHLTVENTGSTTFHFERTTKGPEKNQWGRRLGSVIGSTFMGDACLTADEIRKYFTCLQRLIEENETWESIYKMDRQIQDNWKMLEELIELGIVSPETNWGSLRG